MATTQGRHLLDEDDPPEYTPLPLPEEESIDAGAGAPIVRAQPPRLVINPSDPRSQFTRQFLGGTDSNETAPPLPRRADVASGPIDSRIHSQHSMGYEQMEQPPYMSPRTRASLPHMYGSYTHSLPADDDIRYSTLRDDRTSGRVVNNSPYFARNHWHDGNSGSSSQSGLCTVVCPVCRNSGWVFYKIPCACPVGATVRKSRSRPYHSSLLGFIDDLLAPHNSTYRRQEYPARVNTTPVFRAGPDRQSSSYIQHVPGPGSPCPNCMGQSYFRNNSVSATAAARDVREWLGGTPPPCNVCCDSGRIN
ncbi:hypothetical protein H4S08_002228 [Coemansia sp. RSA 1365]|nr:hypothetical protein H4S08_002228 [Coemansia sp. RSA 1365]